MSTLYIRLPSQAVTGSAPQLIAQACPFALVSDTGAIEREGVAALSSLAETIVRVPHVVLLLAGSDVTLLRVPVPPLSPARLKAALPNLVEDRLLCDPSDCVIVAGGLTDGLRTIAVAQRSWLDLLTRTFTAFGARRIAALPAQLCLSAQSDSVTVAIRDHGSVTDLTLHLTEQEGIGLAINVQPDESATHQVLQTLSAMVRTAPITICVPQSSLQIYREALADIPALKERTNLSADDWTHWITGTRGTVPDLMAGLGTQSGSGLNVRAWRWPLALAAAALLVNIVALNFDWWRMKREAAALRTTLIQTYKSAYPNETVIIDPTAQMQQKITAAQRNSGQAAPDDFTAIMAAFGEAWADAVNATGTSSPAIASFEYRDRTLFVKLKPVLSRVEGTGVEAPFQQMKVALAGRNLSLESAPSSSENLVWQIRGAK